MGFNSNALCLFHVFNATTMSSLSLSHIGMKSKISIKIIITMVQREEIDHRHIVNDRHKNRHNVCSCLYSDSMKMRTKWTIRPNDNAKPPRERKPKKKRKTHRDVWVCVDCVSFIGNPYAKREFFIFERRQFESTNGRDRIEWSTIFRLSSVKPASSKYFTSATANRKRKSD